MRPIKFRVFDGNRMLYDDQLISMDLKGRLFANFGSEGYKSVKMPLMQYIGIKDKNGVEIYESDIIVSKIDYSRPIVVEWEQKDISRTYGHGDYGSDRISGFILDGCYGQPDQWEVIGNIHENPELLEKKL